MSKLRCAITSPPRRYELSIQNIMKNEPDDSACQDDENNTNKEYMEAYDAVCSNLNNKQTSEVLNEANEQHMLTSLGFISDEIGNNIYRVMVRFVAVSLKYNCQRANKSM